VEMAGIEPASESIVPRISTSVVACLISPIVPQTTKENNQLAAGARELLFRTISGVMCGTPALCRPDYNRLESGVGGRDSVRSQTRSLTAYAASGRAETLVRFALVVCADFSRSAPLDSQSGVSHFRRSPSSPSVLLYLNTKVLSAVNGNSMKSNKCYLVIRIRDILCETFSVRRGYHIITGAPAMIGIESARTQ